MTELSEDPEQLSEACVQPYSPLSSTLRLDHYVDSAHWDEFFDAHYYENTERGVCRPLESLLLTLRDLFHLHAGTRA